MKPKIIFYIGPILVIFNLVALTGDERGVVDQGFSQKTKTGVGIMQAPRSCDSDKLRKGQGRALGASITQASARATGIMQVLSRVTWPAGTLSYEKCFMKTRVGHVHWL
ncbi:hypothetical protein HN51_020216 [Arachis hypogaea]